MNQRWRRVGLLLLGAGLGACSGSVACPDIACLSQAQWQKQVTLNDQDELIDLKVCVNDLCSTGRSNKSGCAIAGDLTVTCELPRQGLQTTAFINVNIPTSFKDGDVYTFKITRPTTGEVLAEDSQKATYSVFQPGDPKCGPACANVTLAAR